MSKLTEAIWLVVGVLNAMMFTLLFAFLADSIGKRDEDLTPLSIVFFVLLDLLLLMDTIHIFNSLA